MKNHYKKRNSLIIKPFLNVIKKNNLFILLFVGFLSVSTISTFVVSRIVLSFNQEKILENKDNEKGIGGFGSIESSKESKKTKDELKQIEEGEKLKDSLLGITDKTPDSKKVDEEENELDDLDIPEKTKTKIKKFAYIVKSGDSLYKIAKKFHISIASIAGSSKIRKIYQLSPGQKLMIPTKEGFFYTVKRGERLGNILKRYKVSLGTFVKENTSVNPDLISVNDEIFLPGARPQNLIKVVKWLLPTRSRMITSNYGWRTFPRRAFHKGLDLKAIYTSIKASRAGRVKFAGWLGGYGNAVVIIHKNGYRTLYGHLSRIYVRRGAKVAQGRVIGRSGNTGYSFGPHLHFEISHNGRTINPARKLKGLRHYRRRRH